MSRRGFWHTLGIDRTADVGEIRRAYARRLKELDADLDAATFSELREARDMALHFARRGDGFDPYHEQDATLPEMVLADTDPNIFSESTLESHADDAGGIPIHPDVNAEDLPNHDQAIYDILLGDAADVALIPEEGARLIEHLEALLADPRMAQVGFYAGIEQWLSEIIADSCPRSDPIVLRVVEFFGWQESANRIGQHWAIELVSRRDRALYFVERVQQPSHPYYKAWRELTTPAVEGSRKGLFVGRRKVTELLKAVRSEHPDLERHFDWYRVALWDKPSVEAGSRFGWVLILIVIGFFQIMAALSRIDPGVPGSQAINLSSRYDAAVPRIDQFTDQDRDINVVLRLFDADYSGEQLKKDNPNLYQLLASNWQSKREFGNSRADYVNDMIEMLTRRYAHSYQQASEALLAEFHRLRLEESQFARTSVGWQACADFLEGQETPLQLPEQLRERRRALMLRVLVDVRDEPKAPEGPHQFKIGADVVTAAADKSTLSRQQFVKAMNAEGTAQNRCLARRALIQTVLDLKGEEHSRLLRLI